MITRKPYFLMVLLFLLGCKERSVSQKQDSDKPNVIIVFTDDQGYGDLGYHGNPWIKTPHLDQFASEALELTNFHVGSTCAPSRAGLMTGRNANRNNAWHTIAGCSILLPDEETMAQVFERNGYQTAMFGKWHLGDNYPFRPQDRGFKEAFYHGGGGVNQTPDYWNNDYFDDTYFRNGTPEKVSGYCTDVWIDETIDFIDSAGDKPFFAYVALNAAHGPFNVPESYVQMYESAPLTENQKRFYGMISNIDDNFKRLISHLKQTGQFDNTILIFTTDNGTAAGISKGKEGQTLGYNAGLRGTKGSHYDGGHKVPFFMSWPNGDILRKSELNELTAHVDLLPTLTELAGIPYEPKKPLDGTSIAHILRGNEKELSRMLVVDTQRNQLPEKGRNSCVMSTEWRLIDGKELYNTIDDPGQKSNLADQYPEIVSEMQIFYDDWWTSLEPDIKYAEIPLGNKVANPVLITVHDMHTEGNIPWNQVQIREGKFYPKGFYSVKVEKDGEYGFKLYRYPPESGLFLNASADKIPGNSYRDELPIGNALNIVKAEVKMGTVVSKANANSILPFIELRAKLKAGSYNMQSKFITTNRDEIPAYYTLIETIE
ncbi:MAG: arylsulfatase [Maribacter sp.]